MLKITPDPTFSADVKITVPGQEKPGTIPLTFKYMGSSEFKKFADQFLEITEEDVKHKKDPTPDHFMDFVEKWGLEEEFTKKNVEIFMNNYPAAFFEILLKYRELAHRSRLKN